MAKKSFKEKYTLNERQAEAAWFKKQYPEEIPVILNKIEKSGIPGTEVRKFRVPAHMTVSQLVNAIRKRTKLSSEKAIFLYVDNFVLPGPPTVAFMSSVYEVHKDEDGLLYITYKPSTFDSSWLDVLNLRGLGAQEQKWFPEHDRQWKVHVE